MKLTRYFFVVAVSTALATGLTGCLSQDEAEFNLQMQQNSD